MEKMQFQFHLNEEQKKLKECNYQQLLKNVDVNAWLKEQGVDDAFLYEHTGKIQDWVKRMKQCANCKGQSFCVQPQKGHMLDLYVDTILLDKLVPCRYLVQAESGLSHKKQYRINDCSDQMLRVELDKIDVMKENKDYKQSLVEVIDHITSENPKGIYFYGRPGVGKSYLAAGITNHFAKQGKTCAFIHIPTLVGDLKLLFSDKNAMDRKLGAIKHVDIAVFDDIGGETVSAWSRDEILLSLLNERMEAHRFTIFTSNYSQSELYDHFAISSQGIKEPVSADRIMERIKALSCEKFIKGTSRRV